MFEILPQVNNKGKCIGKKTREAFHCNPKIIHPAVHCWLFNKKNQILWQRRSLQKETSPGKWDISCGGHIKFDEKPIQTIRRELAEELGIKSIELYLADEYVARMTNQAEYIYLYYGVLETPLSKLKLQKEEVEEVKWIDIPEAQNYYLENPDKATRWIMTQPTRILLYRLKQTSQ